jgi:hypothetical protein
MVIGKSIVEPLRNAMWGSIINLAKTSVRFSVRNSLINLVRFSIRVSVRDSVIASIFRYGNR